MHLIVLLGHVDQVKAHFDPFGDSFNLRQDRCAVCTERTMGIERALAHLMVLLSNVCQLEACFGPFGDSVSLGAR
jgi:hypothetical protein